MWRIPYSLETSESELVYDFSSYTHLAEGIALIHSGKNEKGFCYKYNRKTNFKIFIGNIVRNMTLESKQLIRISKCDDMLSENGTEFFVADHFCGEYLYVKSDVIVGKNYNYASCTTSFGTFTNVHAHADQLYFWRRGTNM